MNGQFQRHVPERATGAAVPEVLDRYLDALASSAASTPPSQLDDETVHLVRATAAAYRLPRGASAEAQARVWERLTAQATAERAASQQVQLGHAPSVWYRDLRWSARLVGFAAIGLLITALAIASRSWSVAPTLVSAQEIFEKAQAVAGGAAASQGGVRRFHQRAEYRVLTPGATSTLASDSREVTIWETWHDSQTPALWRWEERVQTRDGQTTVNATNVSDGQTQWLFGASGSRIPPMGRPAGPKVWIARRGEVQPPAPAPDLRHWLEQQGPCRPPSITGQATIAGRPAHVIEFAATTCSGAVPDQIRDGRRILWIDTETYFLLKREQYATDGSLAQHYEVKAIEYNASAPESTYRYTPPPGIPVIDCRPATWGECLAPPVFAVPPSDVPASLAVLVLVHSADSMAATDAHGRTRMDFAREAGAAVLHEVPEGTQVGVLGFDLGPAWVLPLRPVTGEPSRRDALARIGALRLSGTGTRSFVEPTNIFRALVIAHQQLLLSEAPKKHVVLISDSHQALESPFAELLARLSADGISISTIGIGEDLTLEGRMQLESLAIHGGRSRYLSDSADLPDALANETQAILTAP